MLGTVKVLESGECKTVHIDTAPLRPMRRRRRRASQRRMAVIAKPPARRSAPQPGGSVKYVGRRSSRRRRRAARRSAPTPPAGPRCGGSGRGAVSVWPDQLTTGQELTRRLPGSASSTTAQGVHDAHQTVLLLNVSRRSNHRGEPCRRRKANRTPRSTYTDDHIGRDDRRTHSDGTLQVGSCTQRKEYHSRPNYCSKKEAYFSGDPNSAGGGIA